MRRLLMIALFCAFALSPVHAAAGSSSASNWDGWQYDSRDIRELKNKYPEADAIILKHSLRIEMDENGIISRKVLRRTVLITDNAIRRYGDPRILYDSATQELNVSTARVYMRDGTRVDCGDNAFNQTTPFEFSLAPDYANWQEMVVTHVGIEKDCVAELEYTIRDKKRKKSWMSGVEHLTFDDPALVCELTISVPPGKRLRYSCSNGAPEPITAGDGAYEWKLQNVACSPPVNGGIWRGDHLPTVVYSTANDWDEVAGYIAGHFTEGVLQAVDREASSAERSEEIILKLQEECMDCVRSVHAAFGLFDSSPRNAEQIYQSAYAHSLDHAVLLSAKLAEKGIESTPVLVSAGMNCPQEVPAPELFDKILLEAVAEDSKTTLLLDAGRTYLCNAIKMNPNRTLLRCSENAEIIRTERGNPDDNTSTLAITLTINEDGSLAGTGSASMQGAFSPYYSVRGVQNETENFLKKEVERMLPSASMQSWNVNTLQEDHVELGFRFNAKLPDTTESDRIYLSVPKPFCEEISKINNVHVERSEYPVPIRIMPCHMTVSITFDNFSKYDLFVHALQAEEQNNVGSIKADIQMHEQEGNSKITFTKDLKVTKEMIPPGEYKHLRSLLIRYADGPIIMQNKGGE